MRKLVKVERISVGMFKMLLLVPESFQVLRLNSSELSFCCIFE